MTGMASLTTIFATATWTRAISSMAALSYFIEYAHANSNPNQTVHRLPYPPGRPGDLSPRRVPGAPGAGLYQEPGRQGTLSPRQHPGQRRCHQEAGRGE